MSSAGLELLTVDEMRRADRLAAESGVPSLTLMENAGRAVAEAAEEMLRRSRQVSVPGRVVVLCGPGNNGGDGFVAARLLRERGYDVRVALLGSREALKGDAAEMARRWEGEVEAAHPTVLEGAGVVIDALFGAGLSRALDGQAAEVVAAANASNKPILAVDVPSGLDGDTGAAGGPVIEATRTVTFFRRKPGHVLFPGRELCGTVTVADIGIPKSVLREIKPQTYVNSPALWLAQFPSPRLDGHKYDRGHAVVISGPAESTGAARLGARGALRIGAGLVTVASPPDAVAANAAHLTAVMVRSVEGPNGLIEFLRDKRRNAVLLGPGLGIGEATRLFAEAALASEAAVVLDADALTSYEGCSIRLCDEHIAMKPSRPVVLTPHEGEFARLFGVFLGYHWESKFKHCRRAAEAGSAIIVLKGPDTIIAAPDGRAAINENAPPWLATAGSGDVLAGFITGLLAQRMPAFEAASAAVWLHGECANLFGPGLIAEDLPEVLPRVLRALRERDGTWGAFG